MNLTDALRYWKKLKPEEFDRYTAPRGIRLTERQITDLRYFVQKLPLDRNIILYLWRFVFGIDIKIIQRYSNIEHANGIIEALRFACKRYLETDKPISNHAMGKAFVDLMQEYEIVLVSANIGICWVRNKCICAELTKNAITQHNHKQPD